MAKQKGPIKYIGTIGDIRHFKMKGSKEYFAGLVGGPTAEQIKNDPAFERTRENMKEFGGSANVAKSLRISFSQLIKRIADPRIAGRLTGIMRKIGKEDTTQKRRKRGILVSQNKQYLKGVEFNKNRAFSGVFNAQFTLTPNVERNSSDLVIAAFNPMDYINAPAGATHFRISNAIGGLSDFVYNSVSKLYEPVEKDLNEKSNIAYSDYTELETAVASDLTITATLPGSPTMTANITLINVIGIEFYQKVGADYYLFASGHGAKIINLF